MAREVNRLIARQVPFLGPGRHADGGGLYLDKEADGRSRWVFMWSRGGRRREMGLGAAGPSGVGLAEARVRARAARDAVWNNEDPIVLRRKAKEAAATPPKTLLEVATEYRDATAEAKKWRSEKYRQQWLSQMEHHLRSVLSRPVVEVDADMIEDAFKPIWTTKRETAERLRERLEAVLTHAAEKGYRSGPNPARLKTLEVRLGKWGQKTHTGHVALPFRQIAPFMKELRKREAVTARALEFLILTAARTGEVRGARWSEIDFDEAVWTVPASRMKGGRAHEVPLSKAAVQVLRSMEPMRQGEDGFIFPGTGASGDLSVMGIAMLLRRMDVDVTVHGFRSTFRDWAGEISTFPREVAEAALAHRVGNAVELAYRRGTALEKRRLMMEAWAGWCDHSTSAKVQPIRKAQ